MRRGMWIWVLLLIILVGIAVGVGAYNVGFDNGLEEAGRAGEVVRVVGPRYGFPFGLFLFPLFFLGIFFLIRAAFWRRGGAGYGGPGHWGPWGKGGPSAFEEWHRRQHEQGSGDHPGSGGEPLNA